MTSCINPRQQYFKIPLIEKAGLRRLSLQKAGFGFTFENRPFKQLKHDATETGSLSPLELQTAYHRKLAVANA